MEQTRQYPPVRRRRRRRRRLNYRFLVLLAVLAAGIALVIWAVSGNDAPEPSPTDPVRTTQAPTDPTEPTPPPTEPPPPTAEETISAFAAQHGLTLEAYPEKLIELYKRNPEAQDFVLNYPLEYGKEHEIDISGHADEEGVPLFIQWDPRWGYQDYVGSIGGLAACGPTCMAMAVYHFTRDPAMHPGYMMEFAASNRNYANELVITQWAFFNDGAKELGLDSRELTAEELASESKIAAMLDSGKLVVASMGPGVFTEQGHFILLVGYEDGKFKINDPNSREKSAKLWEFEEFSDQIKMMWALSE